MAATAEALPVAQRAVPGVAPRLQDQADRVRPRLIDTVIAELKPYEGRLGKTLRMVLSVMLVVAFMLSQQVPEAVLGCYLIFFAARDDAGSGMLIALALVVAVSVGIGLGLVVMQLSADEPAVRLLLMVFFTFGGMYLSQATRLGPLAATAGFVFVFALSLIDFLPIPKLISHGLSWIWVVVLVPMVVSVFVNALIGPNPAILARKGIAKRLRAAASLLEGAPDAAEAARALLAEDSAVIRSQARIARLFSYHSGRDARRICAINDRSQDLLALALAAGRDPDLAADLDVLADAIEKTARRSALPATAQQWSGEPCSCAAGRSHRRDLDRAGRPRLPRAGQGRALPK